MLKATGNTCSIKVPAFREFKQSYKNYNLPSTLHTKKTGSIPFTFFKQKRGLGEELGSWAIPTSAINSGKYKSPSVRLAAVHAPSVGGTASPLITPKELSACLAKVFSFTIFQITSPLIAFAGTLGHQYFPFLLSIPPTHRNFPHFLFLPFLVWIWWRFGFYPFGV